MRVGAGEGSRYYPQQHSKVRTCAKIAGEESGGVEKLASTAKR